MARVMIMARINLMGCYGILRYFVIIFILECAIIMAHSIVMAYIYGEKEIAPHPGLRNLLKKGFKRLAHRRRQRPPLRRSVHSSHPGQLFVSCPSPFVCFPV